MKKLNKATDFSVIIKYLLFFLLFLTLNNLEKAVMPYSVSIFVAGIADGCSVIASSILILASLIICGASGQVASIAILCGFFLIIKIIYKKINKNGKLIFSAFTIIGMLGFILLGDTSQNISIEKRLLVSIITSFLSFIFTIAITAVTKKGLKYKMNYEELLSLTLICVLFGLGLSNFISPLVWKGLSVLITLLVCYLYRFGTGTLISSVLGISLAIYSGNLAYVSVYIIWGLVSDSLMSFSRYLSAITLLLVDYLISLIFNIGAPYTINDFIPTLIGVAIFVVIPTKPLKALKDKLYAFREKQLTRQTINRNRLTLSNRLYELSGVFTEMSNAFSSFNKSQITAEKAKDEISKEIVSSVCGNCDNKHKCKNLVSNNRAELNKMIDVGFAKSKLSFIDIPLVFTNNCVKNSDLIYGINKMLASYKNHLQCNDNLSVGRDLIASETSGVAEILKGLALEAGSLLKFNYRLERTLNNALLKSGFFASELLIYGEDTRLTISLVLTMREFSLKELTSVINKNTGLEMEVSAKNNLTEEKCYIEFKRAPVSDAIFGIASAIKDNSVISGDTHAVLRINEDKFLVALSDGMGSGKDAQNISATALSLIESFYKAGMDNELILSTVNKLLSINAEDTFTALDVTVIDLFSASADFIKYGSPYGFIISDNGVKIIEGNTLPLGILQQLKPSVCSTTLNQDDVILLLTDGISDAFGSSNEIIDYLRKVPAKNPQTLADDILREALNRTDGKKPDDMTALAVRIFKKDITA